MEVIRTMRVVCVHGEGDQTTVNALEQHRKVMALAEFTRRHPGTSVPDDLMAKPDVPPDVLVVLDDPHTGRHLEIRAIDWEEVDVWKKIVGWDPGPRQWKAGAEVIVRIG